MKRTIYFDMDGTLVDFYGVKGWLECLQEENAHPYGAAKAKIRLCALARVLNRKKRQGYRVGIISWASKQASSAFTQEIDAVKREWVKKHLKSVSFDDFYVIPYGTPKSSCKRSPLDILFDDEQPNRAEWGGGAFDEKDIINTLKSL